MAEQESSDDSPERPTKEESTIGRIGAKLITTIPKPLLGVRGTLFKRMAIKSIENYHKAVGGDAIAINAKPGQQIALEPVAYRSPEQLDEGEAPGWRVKGRDKVWNPGAEGNSVNYLGRTPTVLLEDDDHVEAGWLAPRIGTAIELDNYWPVFRNAEINAVVDYQPNTGATNGGAARADGGANIELELDHPGEWAEDNIVDLDSGPDYDGMRISTKKAREWRAEHTDSEQMQQQEDRGYLMGLAKGDDTNVTRLFLYAALFSLAVIGLVYLGPRLLGGGGGAGGSINPLMTALGAFGVV
jgi:hypothetical protein